MGRVPVRPVFPVSTSATALPATSDAFVPEQAVPKKADKTSSPAIIFLIFIIYLLFERKKKCLITV